MTIYGVIIFGLCWLLFGRCSPTIAGAIGAAFFLFNLVGPEMRLEIAERLTKSEEMEEFFARRHRRIFLAVINKMGLFGWIVRQTLFREAFLQGVLSAMIWPITMPVNFACTMAIFRILKRGIVRSR